MSSTSAGVSGRSLGVRRQPVLEPGQSRFSLVALERAQGGEPGWWGLGRGFDAYLLAAYGVLAGIAAFSCVIFAAPLGSLALFVVGATVIGFGGGLFAVGTLTAAMQVAQGDRGGLILGVWGAVQASAAGLGIALGGAIRDVVAGLAAHGTLGVALVDPSTGYLFVYHLEIALLFVTLVAVGPLARRSSRQRRPASSRFGLAELPG